MHRMNSIERAKYIKQEYQKYILSSFRFEDKDLQHSFENQLEKNILYKGPYISINMPFEKGKNINELVDEGVLAPDFVKLGGLQKSRLLYKHQELAIRHLTKGNSAVITTGTGSGKTECYLYPILDYIIRNLKKTTEQNGVRALFLYPLNALIMDQMDRVRDLLKDYPEITFGFYTGDTPNDNREKVIKERQAVDAGVVIPDNEKITRAEMQSSPPHLLFTNYTMLEYLLMRPADKHIVSERYLQNWQYVVLDEAHTYRGALGIEISMLLQRLTARSNKRVNFILTSATLGKEDDEKDDIIEFANGLTGEKFSKEDIFFSKRVSLTQPQTIKLKFSHIHELYKVLTDETIENSRKDTYVQRICKEYDIHIDNNYQECLYELLGRDYYVHKLYHILINSSKDIKDVLREMGDTFDSDLLSKLLELIAYADKNNEGLYEVSYHSFIGTLFGAYTTLGKKRVLSLLPKFETNGLKMFEIANCKKCHTEYIVGKIVNIYEKQYLFQNQEIDIYADYESKGEEFLEIEEDKTVDYFLLEKNAPESVVSKAFSEDKDKEYTCYSVCIKCGLLTIADDLNAVKCDCDNPEYEKIYHIKDVGIYNNLRHCVCCDCRGSRVITTLSTGKAEGSTAVAEILYDSLLESSSINGTHSATSPQKQLIMFSDSRGDASIAPTLIDNYNMYRFRRNLIWKVIKQNNFQYLTMEDLIKKLDEQLKQIDFNAKDIDYTKEVWASVLSDLLYAIPNIDIETLGLFHYDINEDLLPKISESDISKYFEEKTGTKVEMSIEEFYSFIQEVFKCFRVNNAIDFSEDIRKKVEGDLLYKKFFFSYHECNKKDYQKNFLPEKTKENHAVSYIKKVFKCDREKARNIAGDLFKGLTANKNIMTPYKDGYKINIFAYVLKNYRNDQYYKCDQCGKVTTHNVKGICPKIKCQGVLKKINPDEYFKNNFHRQQYLMERVERPVVEEHTAQLQREKGREYQQKFKNKEINILSCSTTFEMGIDVGGLETVFMRNVPPSPANYVQRAGRAGRRKGSASFVLTYCYNTSHDYYYFQEPEQMISGIIRAPKFKENNEKIISRHILSVCLAYFFRENIDYFGDFDKFIEKGVEDFKRMMDSRPAKLQEYLHCILRNKEAISVWDLYEIALSRLENMQLSIAEKNEKKKQIEIQNPAINKAKREMKIPVLDALSRYSIIPKYGFPVDVVSLQILDNYQRQTSLNLTRDLQRAISEYAPGSEVVADKKRYVSQYIVMPSHGAAFKKIYYVECDRCGQIDIEDSFVSNHICSNCGNEKSFDKDVYYITPFKGFYAVPSKNNSTSKPERTYTGEILYLGAQQNGGAGGKTNNVAEDQTNNVELEIINDRLKLFSCEADELLVLNTTHFHVCGKCGYSLPIKKGSKTSIKVERHRNPLGKVCDGVVSKVYLGHSYCTDVIRIECMDFVADSIDGNKRTYGKALSFLYALLEGLSLSLNIDRLDIDGIIKKNMKLNTYDLIIFDTVPGGAGHVKRLLKKREFIRVLKFALKKVSQECCTEEGSCYRCLKNYYNQAYHKKIKRGWAKEVIMQLLEDIE